MEGLISEISTLFTVVIIDLVLAGDNAIVVGLAASGLPREQRKRVIMIGIVLAMVMRIAFALVAVQLLAIVGLLFAGGLLLLWVAWKMWRELQYGPQDPDAAIEERLTAAQQRPGKKAGTAIWQIALADVSMSLDNVLAVAGVARDHMGILIFGLVLSIALMGITANYIASLLVRYHWLSYAGLAIITFVALSMMYEGAVEIMHALPED